MGREWFSTCICGTDPVIEIFMGATPVCRADDWVELAICWRRLGEKEEEGTQHDWEVSSKKKNSELGWLWYLERILLVKKAHTASIIDLNVFVQVDNSLYTSCLWVI